MQYYFPFLDIGSQFKLRTPIYPCKKISREQNIEALEKKKKMKLGVKIFADILGRVLEV